MSAAQQWAAELAAWALPARILEQAPSRPYVFPPALFAAEPGPPTPSSQRAAEALDGGGSLLDVGCGGGVAAFAVTPPATSLVGTDRQADMLELFARTARERGVPVRTVAGSWPDVAVDVPQADVVVCHHVLYNVPDLVPFVAALTDRAARRVVVEISDRHPQVARAPLWQRFWDLDRPAGPTAELAVQVLHDAGVPVQVERFTAPPRGTGHSEVEAAFWCRQLCLPADREPEVAEALAGLPAFVDRVTLWWDA